MRRPRTGYRAAAAVAIGLVLPAAAPHAHGAPAAPGTAEPAASRIVPERAPDFARVDIAGHPVRLRDYRGKLVLLSFWATWCEPCRVEAPRFSEWQRRYGPQGLQILGISMDDDVSAVATFVRDLGLSYPIVMGDTPLAEQFGGVLGLPLSFLIDPAGRIVGRFRGEPDLGVIEQRIRASLSALRR